MSSEPHSDFKEKMKMHLAEAQVMVSRFTKEKNIDSPASIRIIDLASEVGELAKEVLKATEYGNKEFGKTEDWDSEIGDVLFSLICLANATGTDLEACLRNVLMKYEQRFISKGDVGSGK